MHGAGHGGPNPSPVNPGTWVSFPAAQKKVEYKLLPRRRKAFHMADCTHSPTSSSPASHRCFTGECTLPESFGSGQYARNRGGSREAGKCTYLVHAHQSIGANTRKNSCTIKAHVLNRNISQ